MIAKNKNVAEWSERSETVTALTKESVPDPPSKLIQDQRDETSLTVSWTEPALIHGLLFGYRAVLLGQDGDPGRNITMEFEPYISNHTFVGLRPGSTYALSLAARTGAGYGKPLEIVVYTRAPLPEVQTEVQLGDVDDNTITLSLTAPSQDEPQDVRAYYVIVFKDEPKNRTRRSSGPEDGVREWTGGRVDYNASVEMGLPFYMAARLNPAQLRNQSRFTVGDGRYYDGFYNAPLVTGATYSVGLASEVDFQGDVRMSYKLLSTTITGTNVPFKTNIVDSC